MLCHMIKAKLGQHAPHSFDLRIEDRSVTANLLHITNEGSWLLPFWQEGHTSYDKGLACSGVLRSTDKGKSWAPFGEVHSNQTWLIENTLGQLRNSTEIVQLFRTEAGLIYYSTSVDDGKTWASAEATSTLNPNSKTCMCSRSDRDGLILAYNPSSSYRNPISLASSWDGKDWKEFVTLDSGPPENFAYPTPIQVSNSIYTTYSASTSNGIKLAIASLPDSEEDVV
eukprot:m.98440 g.98440  ORF g.98440 m.98440 type:complete len:226 (+) comp22103_c0_seq2:439-1116(+)